MSECGAGNAEHQQPEAEHRAGGEHNTGQRGEAAATAGPVNEDRLPPGTGLVAHDREYIDEAKW
jgi:hypothetical protein